MRGSRYVCRSCSNAIRPSGQCRPLFWSVALTAPGHQRSIQSGSIAAPPRTSRLKPAKSDQFKQFWGSDWTIFSADNAALVRKAQTLGDQVLSSKTIPSEEDILKTLEVIKYAALKLASTSAFKESSESGPPKNDPTIKPSKKAQSRPTKTQPKDSPHDHPDIMSDILSLDHSASSVSHPVSVSITTTLLSSLAYKILIHPPVFVTDKVLSTYVSIQTTLRRTSTLPEAFDLYVYKPIPVPDSSPIRYKDPSPNAASHAVPAEVADRALDVAVRERELTLALDIISSTYAMPAFRRNRFIRKAMPALTGITITPLAAFPLARAWASTSLAADPQILTTYTFLGIITYVAAVSSMGLIAVTTHNDQMERVTWMPGMPLRHRWLREDERAAADKVAVAWGFKESHRRGDEEGAEWDMLRTWCGRRGMLLDNPDLMEGME